MKHSLLPYVVLVLLTLSVTTAIAQNEGSKPKLFAGFPDKLDCTTTVLSQAFAATQNQDAALGFSANFLFSGKVISNTVKYSTLQTMVIRSAAFSDAIFVLSKITNADNSVEYKGRIVNTKYADGYELKKDEKGNYQLVKFETDKVLQDCKQ